MLQEMRVTVCIEQAEVQLSVIQIMLLELHRVPVALTSNERSMQASKPVPEYSNQRHTELQEAFQLVVRCNSMILGAWSMSVLIARRCIGLMNAQRAV